MNNTIRIQVPITESLQNLKGVNQETLKKNSNEDTEKYNSIENSIKTMNQQLTEKNDQLKNFGWRFKVFSLIKNWFNVRILNVIAQLILNIFPSLNQIRNIHENAENLKIDLEWEKQEFKNLKTKMPNFKKITDLFGGEDNYYKLPVLDPKGKNRFTEVNAKDMNAPIMRGRTGNGIRFFYLRLQAKQENSKPYVICFHERYIDNGQWTYDHELDIKDTKSLLSYNGKPYLIAPSGKTDEFYDHLSRTIKNNENEYERLV